MGILSFLSKKPAGDGTFSTSSKNHIRHTNAASRSPVRGKTPASRNGLQTAEETTSTSKTPATARTPIKPRLVAIRHVDTPTAPLEEENYDLPLLQPKLKVIGRSPRDIIPISGFSLPTRGSDGRRPSQISAKSATSASRRASAFVDILDARGEIKPSDFRSRIEAAGSRDYGEDVADRNLAKYTKDSSKAVRHTVLASPMGGPGPNWVNVFAPASSRGIRLAEPIMEQVEDRGVQHSTRRSSVKEHSSLKWGGGAAAAAGQSQGARCMSLDSRSLAGFSQAAASRSRHQMHEDDHYSHRSKPRTPLGRISVTPTHEHPRNMKTVSETEVRSASPPAVPRFRAREQLDQVLDSSFSTRPAAGSVRLAREAMRTRPSSVQQGRISPFQHATDSRPRSALASYQQRPGQLKINTTRRSSRQEELSWDDDRAASPCSPAYTTGSTTHSYLRPESHGSRSIHRQPIGEYSHNMMQSWGASFSPGSSSRHRTRSLSSASVYSRPPLDEITEHIPTRAMSRRQLSISSFAPTMTTSSEHSGLPYTTHPRSIHTANTSIDFSYAPHSPQAEFCEDIYRSGSRESNTRESTMEDDSCADSTVASPATPKETEPKVRMNKEFEMGGYDSTSIYDSDSDSFIEKRRRLRHDGEVLLFKDEGFGTDSGALPGLFDELETLAAPADWPTETTATPVETPEMDADEESESEEVAPRAEDGTATSFTRRERLLALGFDYDTDSENEDDDNEHKDSNNHNNNTMLPEERALQLLTTMVEAVASEKQLGQLDIKTVRKLRREIKQNKHMNDDGARGRSRRPRPVRHAV